MGYHYVPIAEEDKAKTAVLSRYGLLQYTVMPFGLTNGPVTFQRLMERVLAHMNWKDCLVYIDDILIYSKTFAKHLEKLNSVFNAFDKAVLRIKAKKCHICCPWVPYLGHVLFAAGIEIDPGRVSAIANMRPLTSKKELQIFLGLVNYYRRFNSNLSRVDVKNSQICGCLTLSLIFGSRRIICCNQKTYMPEHYIGIPGLIGETLCPHGRFRR